MSREKQIDIIEDLLIDFDEMGFIPTTTVPDPDVYAIEWKNKLIEALKGYRKASDVAREIFEEIDAHFDKRIALYQTMKSRALLVGNDVELKYADTMIINLTIYKKEIAELKNKYTEEGK